MKYAMTSTTLNQIIDLPADMARAQYRLSTAQWGQPITTTLESGRCWQWYTEEGVAIYLFQYKENATDLDRSVDRIITTLA